MFIEVVVVLTGVEISILLFDKENGRGLEGVRRTDFAGLEIFSQEVFYGFLLVEKEGIDFANLRDKGFIKVDFGIVRLGWGDVVSGFYGEDRGEFRIFRE